MNKTEKYLAYGLCRDMMESPDLIKNFDASRAEPLTEKLSKFKRIMLTGEGSSRNFPAKHAVSLILSSGAQGPWTATEGSLQASEYNLKDSGILGLSNSGRTSELISLFKILQSRDHSGLCGISAGSETPLEEVSQAFLQLNCGEEHAVAATKSVVEQALLVEAVILALFGLDLPDYHKRADAFNAALSHPLDNETASKLDKADRLYFAGRNNGAAEELTLKTNEIVRIPSGYLEGTYLVHGIEEVLGNKDLIIALDPFDDVLDKIESCLVRGADVPVIGVTPGNTPFPGIQTDSEDPFVYLAAGWNLLVETGLSRGINPDVTKRARKVGNEVQG